MQGRSERVTVVVHDERGPIQLAVVSATDALPNQTGLTGHDGKAVLRVQKLPTTVTVRAFGYRPRTLRRVRGALRVAMQRGVPVRIRTEAKTHGRKPDYKLTVEPKP